MSSYHYIVIISILLIASHLFNMAAAKYKIPTVIFLISSGYILKILTRYFGYSIDIPFTILQILGTVGLVMIVLEGTLDLKLEKEKIEVMKKSLIIGLIMLVLSAVSIALVISFFTKAELIKTILYAIPLSIISSAIVIPSIGSLSELKKEFMIYEATFSDIIGILIFNFFAFAEISSINAISDFAVSILAMIIISIIASGLLIFILGKTKDGTKIVMLLSTLLLLYSIGKMYHLSALILVLIFGIAINNFDKIIYYLKLKEKTRTIFNSRNTLMALREMKLVNGELSFAIRTMFFIIFGYSIELSKIFDNKIILVGVIILIIIYITRYINLRMFLRTEIFPEIMIAPRGLITILLFYIIPQKYQIPNFEEGLLFFIIISTSVIMMIGLIIYKKPVEVINREDF